MDLGHFVIVGLVSSFVSHIAMIVMFAKALEKFVNGPLDDVSEGVLYEK